MRARWSSSGPVYITGHHTPDHCRHEQGANLAEWRQRPCGARLMKPDGDVCGSARFRETDVAPDTDG